jgi:UDPglucose 6-dehydrogenase
LTYKPGTSTLRRSTAIEIIRDLVGRGAAIKAFDPKADPAEVALHRRAFSICTDPYAAAKDADALALVTPWPEFKDLDLARLKEIMRTPVILDATNMLEPAKVTQAGFVYQGIGRGSPHR